MEHINNENEDVKVVGYKSTSALLAYAMPSIFLLIFNIAFYAFLFGKIVDSNGMPIAILSASIISGLLIAFAVLCILVMILPRDLVAVSDTEVILLAKKQSIPFSEISQISSKKAPHSNTTNKSGAHHSNREVRYGKLIIKTKSGDEFIQKHLTEVRTVSNELNEYLSAHKKSKSRKKKSV